MKWHSSSIKEVLDYFNVEPQKGLTSHQVKQNREKFGRNILPGMKITPWWKTLLEQFNNPVILILIVAAILNGYFSDLKDTFVIGFVVVLNTIIGFFSERKASDALKALRQMASPTAKVIRINASESIRNGLQQIVDTSDVVCGDLIVLESGMRVPADARLLETQSLIIDESMLTGESFAITKKSEAKIEEDAPLGDRLTMVYSGTIVQKGRGIALVTSVGALTEIGKISTTVAEATETESPLQKQIAKFGKVLSLAIMGSVIAIFLIGLLRDFPPVVMFLTSVGLAVSAIPEGLPVAVTITLSIGLYLMAKQNAVVKKLSAVETLGSTNVICTDKTGTLTKNQMIATKLFCGGEDFEVTGSGYEKAGTVVRKSNNKQVIAKDSVALKNLALISKLCTETVITEEGTEWKVTGDPTEAALMIAAVKMELDCKQCNLFVDIPFESENQLMAVRAESANVTYTFAKGAPEKVLERCKDSIDYDGNTIALNKEKLLAKVKEYSSKGLRVLALAYTPNDKNEILTFDNLKNLSFAGFVGIEDSVRPEAVDAVHQCNSAGIRVVMITGDHAVTAQAIGKAIGLGQGKEIPLAVTGQELEKLSDDELYKKVPDIDVYARVEPQHKYRIVKQIQKHNKTVAMTGDGVNDAPALKQADIGIAMGSGTDVAKEAAQMVLMDDNFATIVAAVRRGRVILKNLQHIILYILSTSFGGLLTLAASVIAGLPLPLMPAQLLWVNLVTDGTSTFPLAFEKEHGNVMRFHPRPQNAPLISGSMYRRIIFAGVLMMVGTLGVFFFSVPDIFALLHIEPGDDIKMMQLRHSQTMAFCVLAFFQIWNVQNSRSVERSLFFNLPFSKSDKLDKIKFNQNPTLFLVMLLAIVLQVAAVQIPFMNYVFNTVPLSLNDWIVVAAVTLSIIVFIEIIKFAEALVHKHRRMKKYSK